MKANYLPLGDRVVVSVPKKEEEQTSSGIYIPVEAQEEHLLREVLVEAVGDGVKSDGQSIKMFLKPGQTVVIGRNTGVEYEQGGTTFRILRQDDVQFIVTE